jgi:hypothetical protein
VETARVLVRERLQAAEIVINKKNITIYYVRGFLQQNN